MNPLRTAINGKLHLTVFIDLFAPNLYSSRIMILSLRSYSHFQTDVISYSMYVELALLSP